MNFTSTYSSGEDIKIVNSNNNEVMSYTSTKSFSSLVFSSNKLKTGTYNDHNYQTFTVNSIPTTVGNSSGMGSGNNPKENLGGRR